MYNLLILIFTLISCSSSSENSTVKTQTKSSKNGRCKITFYSENGLLDKQIYIYQKSSMSTEIAYSSTSWKQCFGKSHEIIQQLFYNKNFLTPAKKVAWLNISPNGFKKLFEAKRLGKSNAEISHYVYPSYDSTVYIFWEFYPTWPKEGSKKEAWGYVNEKTKKSCVRQGDQRTESACNETK